MFQITVSSLDQTEKLAADLAALLPPAVTILLAGDLGAGKTAFARAFIRALAGDADTSVTSPTFNLVVRYDTLAGAVYHYDLYRIDNPRDLSELAFEDAASARACLIEWPDRLGPRLQDLPRVVQIHFKVVGPNTRVITIDGTEITTVPDTAFLFAAGLGQRMRPLTDTTPKPMIKVAGRPILDYACETMAQTGITRVIMNTHYLPGQIDAFAESCPHGLNVQTMHEPELLETGGGLVNALSVIGRDVFFALNGDALLTDQAGALPYLARLALVFDPDRMDILLLVSDLAARSVTPQIGDYTLDQMGRAHRSRDQTGTHMFTGARILHARVFDGIAPGRFSFLDQMDRAEQAGRLYALVHTGMWHHLSTPEDVVSVDAFMRGAG